MTTEDQANALLKAAEEATPEPWIVHTYKRSNVSAYKIERGLPKTSVALRIANKDGLPVVTKRGLASPSTDQGKSTAAFIALARNTAPAIASALLEKHKALEEACDLFRSICAAYENQDLSHVQFRVKCAEFAQDFLARQGETASKDPADV